MDDLPDRNRLPPAHARHLLAELEAKPFTPAMLFAERHAHPAVEALTGPTPQPTEHDFTDAEVQAAYQTYAKRRRHLMDLLRTAIELNEPLFISG
jgi:hypothetical protein